MMNEIKRQGDIDRATKLIDQFPVVAVIGPRQCGKTVFVKQLNYDHYFNLSVKDHAQELSESTGYLASLEGLVIIDDVHLQKKFFSSLRQIIDQSTHSHFVILGSASLEVSRLTSRNLLGRAAIFELGGLTLDDVGREYMMRHLVRGGFPDSYLAPSDEASLRWRKEYISQYFYSDLVAEGHGLSPHNLGNFWQTIGLHQGNSINLSLRSSELGISRATAEKYTDILESAGLVQTLHQRKQSEAERPGSVRKIYIRDSGLLNSTLGIAGPAELSSYENKSNVWVTYGLENLIKKFEISNEGINFWRGKDGKELDLIWEKEGKIFAAEFKWDFSPDRLRSFEQISHDLNLDHLWVIHADNDKTKRGESTSFVPLAQISIPGATTKSAISEKKTAGESKFISFPRKRKVFISYSHRDESFVRKLVSILDKSKIPFVIDSKALCLGDDIDEFVRKSIRSTQATILIISENSLRSPWVMTEFLETLMSEILQDKKKLLPVHIDKRIFDPSLYLEIDNDIQSKIDEIKTVIIKALNRNIHISYYVDIWERLLDLKNNLDKALKKLSGSLIADFSNDVKLQKNLPLLLDRLR